MKKEKYKSVEVVAIIDKRMHYSEGRSYGLGFAMAKKISDEKYETVHHPSACKDYLNDVVLVETFNIDVPSVVCGLNYKRQGIYDKDGSSYLFIHPLKMKDGSVPQNFDYDKEIANLHSRIGVIHNTVNELEEALVYDSRTEVFKASNNDGYLLHIPKEWVANQLMISMLSLVVRVAQYMPEKPSYLGFVSFCPSLDHSYLVRLKQCIQYLLETKQKVLPFILPASWKTMPGSCHGYGIVSFNLMTYNDGKSLENPIKGSYVTDGSIHFDDKAAKVASINW